MLLQIIESDKSYNRSATRYLYRSHPDLWKDILDKTSFLPDDAKPKQRIWHVLNDVWEIPVCPESGKQSKWWENRYLTFSTRSAKASYQNKKGLYKNHTIESNKKRSLTMKQGYQSGKITPVQNRNIDYIKGSETRKKTNLEKYGVENPAKHPAIRKKISEVQIANGATPRHMRSDRALYREAVLRYTKESWNDHFDKVNPLRLDRSRYTLDHIYSIQQGFLDNIPSYIIGHWTNLRMISKKENSSKGMRCDKSQEQLFEDFFQES